MTNRQRRAVLYARKSSKDDRGEEQSASVADQLERCRAYANDHGWAVVAENHDDGRSGLLGRARRPGLDATLDVVEAGKADVLVTLWTSRLSRKESDRAQILDVLDEYDVDWHAVADGGRIERDSYSGYVNYGVHTIFDVAYSKRVKENWRSAHTKRLEAGLPKTTSPRFGYTYEYETSPSGRRSGGRYVVHEAEGEIVRDLYRRYARGVEGFTQLVRWLNSEGWRVKATDKEWSVRTLSRFLDSGFAVGYISREIGDSTERKPNLRELHKGSHKPLITQQEWDAYRAQREKQATLGRKTSGSSERWWLAGLVRCGTCGSGTYIDSFKRQTSSVMCAGKRGNPASCDGKSILRSSVERAVGLWLGGYLDHVAALTKLESNEVKTAAAAAAEAYQAAVAARDKVANGLADLEVSKALGDIQPVVFSRAKDKLSARLLAAEKVVKNAAAELAKPAADPSKLRGAAERGWNADERAALRGVLDRVEVGKDALTIVPVTGEPTTRTRAELAPRCGVSGCGRVGYTRGLCKSHVMRSRKVGDDVFEALAQRVGDAEEAPERTPSMAEVEAVLTAAHDVAV